MQAVGQIANLSYYKMEMNENKNLDCFDRVVHCVGVNLSCDSIRSGNNPSVYARGDEIPHLRLDPRPLAARGGR